MGTRATALRPELRKKALFIPGPPSPIEGEGRRKLLKFMVNRSLIQGAAPKDSMKRQASNLASPHRRKSLPHGSLRAHHVRHRAGRHPGPGPESGTATATCSQPCGRHSPAYPPAPATERQGRHLYARRDRQFGVSDFSRRDGRECGRPSSSGCSRIMAGPPATYRRRGAVPALPSAFGLRYGRGLLLYEAPGKAAERVFRQGPVHRV